MVVTEVVIDALELLTEEDMITEENMREVREETSKDRGKNTSTMMIHHFTRMQQPLVVTQTDSSSLTMICSEEKRRKCSPKFT
jgi:hypothetical protein